MKLFSVVRLNFGKRGIGISAGVPGLRVGVDSRGKDRSYAKKGYIRSPTQSGRGRPGALGLVLLVLVLVFLSALR